MIPARAARARRRRVGAAGPAAAAALALVLALVLALSGCVGAPDDGETPAPSASPSATEVPSKPKFDDLVVSPAGLGSLRVGRKASNSGMISYFPDYCATAKGEGRSDEGRWQNTYVSRGKPRPFGVDVTRDGRVSRIDILDPDLRTAEGIGLGTSVEKLLTTYPALQGGTASTLADLYYLRASEGTLVFEVANDLIEDYYEDDVVGTVIFMRVVAPTVDPDQSLAGTDFYAGTCR
jgi:hypothetical protein